MAASSRSGQGKEMEEQHCPRGLKGLLLHLPGGGLTLGKDELWTGLFPLQGRGGPPEASAALLRFQGPFLPLGDGQSATSFGQPWPGPEGGQGTGVLRVKGSAGLSGEAGDRSQGPSSC